jgi:F-type H+-transporting ATPase subunit alpha
LPAYRAVAGDLRLSYAQFEEFETFARFGTRLDPETRQAIERGRRVREILKQYEHDLQSVSEQIAVLFAATQGLLDPVPIEEIAAVETAIRARVRLDLRNLCERIETGHDLDAHARAQLRATIEAVLREHAEASDKGGH